MIENTTSSLRLAIVGHTNVGKTSLMRTLLRDPQFGQVAATPSTTRRSEERTISLQHGFGVTLIDTPGLEDGMGLFDYLEQISDASTRHNGPELLQRFLQSPEAARSFAQEALVIQQLLTCDAALYVIDARDPVLDKFQDELAILVKSARPVLPVLNFTANSFTAGTEHQVQEWQNTLTKVNLHTTIEFDSVSPPTEGELLIYRQLQTLLPASRAKLEEACNVLKNAQQQRSAQATQLIAELLIDCAAYRQQVYFQDDSSPASSQAVAAMQQTVRQRETAFVQSLLRLYNFTPDSLNEAVIAVEDGRWKDDLFNPLTLRNAGLKAGKGAATGAAAGAGIDIILLGTTLGAGTAIGAAIGGVWNSWSGYGRRLRDKLRGYRELSVSDPILWLLLLRAQQLQQQLERRGHAANQPLNRPTTYQSMTTLPAEIGQARAYPDWSALTPKSFHDSTERQRAVFKLHQRLTSGPIQPK